MLKKKYRLSILRTRDKIKTIDAGTFILKISKNNLSNSRFGFSVSRTYDKRAVVRNRIKRIFRYFVQENLENIEKGHDFLFIIKAKAKKENPKKFLETFKKTLIKEKVFK